jgi:hypothetical protein
MDLWNGYLHPPYCHIACRCSSVITIVLIGTNVSDLFLLESFLN